LLIVPASGKGQEQTSIEVSPFNEAGRFSERRSGVIRGTANFDSYWGLSGHEADIVGPTQITRR
jgi:hypothetical protein